jgi:hypothetical protein
MARRGGDAARAPSGGARRWDPRAPVTPHSFPVYAGPKFATANSSVGASEASSLTPIIGLAGARAVVNPAGLDPACAGKGGRNGAASSSPTYLM